MAHQPCSPHDWVQALRHGYYTVSGIATIEALLRQSVTAREITWRALGVNPRRDFPRWARQAEIRQRPRRRRHAVARSRRR